MGTYDNIDFNVKAIPSLWFSQLAESSRANKAQVCALTVFVSGEMTNLSEKIPLSPAVLNAVRYEGVHHGLPLGVRDAIQFLRIGSNSCGTTCW